MMRKLNDMSWDTFDVQVLLQNSGELIAAEVFMYVPKSDV